MLEGPIARYPRSSNEIAKRTFDLLYNQQCSLEAKARFRANYESTFSAISSFNLFDLESLSSWKSLIGGVPLLIGYDLCATVTENCLSSLEISVFPK